MAVDVTWEPRGRRFIPQVLAHQKFRATGFLTGVSAAGYYYVVVDPRRHPFHIWKKSLFGRFATSPSAYENSALDLNAVAFSNGPMMDIPTAGEVFRKLLIQVGFWTLALAVGFAIAAAVVSGGIGLPVLVAALVAGAGGAALGVLAFAIEMLQRGCVPFNLVRGAKHGINEAGRGFNGNHVWFGRGASPDFPSFEVDGPGAVPPGVPPTPAPPPGLTEVCSGLMPLVIGFAARSSVPGTPSFNQGYANLAARMGAVAWALIPLSGGGLTWTPLGAGEGPLTPAEFEGVDLVMPGDTTPLTGVIMTIGHYSAAFNVQAAGLLSSIGTRDAAAMDGSDSVMLGSEQQLFPIFPPGSQTFTAGTTGSPPFYKQYIQKYGFYTQ